MIVSIFHGYPIRVDVTCYVHGILQVNDCSWKLSVQAGYAIVVAYNLSAFFGVILWGHGLGMEQVRLIKRLRASV